MVTLFISDLHLHASRPHITERFFKFLKEQAPKAEAVYILGDFFEVWAGDDHFNEHDTSVINALADFSKTNILVYFMHGNRDFLIGQRFAKLAKCILIPDPTVIELYGNRVLLMHGDSLCTLDVSHQRFRKFSRNPIIRWLFLFLPRSLRSKVAGEIRAASKRTQTKEPFQPTSRTSNSQAKEVIEKSISNNEKYDVTQNAVEKALKTHKAFCLIHGHTHKPGIHNFCLNNNEAKRIVLGEWGEKGNMLAFEKDSIELISI